MTSRALQVLGSVPVKGALVGLCATTALDAISTFLYENESPALRLREDAVRGGLHAYERAVVKLARLFGAPLSRREAKRWGWRFHKAFGVLGGVQYVAMRRIAPHIGRALGLPFGIGFFAVADELLMPLLRLTPGPRRFSWKVHARGAIAHILYGVVAEMTARLVERMAQQRTQEEAIEGLEERTLPAQAIEGLGQLEVLAEIEALTPAPRLA